MVKWVTPNGRVFKIRKKSCTILSVFDVDKGHDKWVTPNGVTHLIMPLTDVKIRKNHTENIMDFEHPT